LITFSIIVPVYNGQSHIRETIDSVIKHSQHQHKEILVVNDGSTDKTLEILQRYQPEITIISQANGGEASAVNLGINAAKGKYILVVSADDPLISEDLFNQAQNILDNNEELVAAYPDWQMIDSKNDVLSVKYCPEYSFEELLGRFHCIPGPGAVFRAKDAKEIGGRSAEYRFVSDYDFWLRLACKGSFAHIPHVLAQWRSHSDSTSIGLRGYEMALERISVVQNFLTKYPQDEILTRQAKACSLYNAAILALFDSDVPGRKWMVEALIINKKWINSSKFIIVAYLLTLPFSRPVFTMLSALGLTKKRIHK
jgi:glycosyltransferase involved in cell wall biosynthesis